MELVADRKMDHSTITTSNSSAHGAERASAIELGSRDVESARNDLTNISDADDSALDWRGRRATTSHGGPQTSFYILANQGLWNVANTAVSANLVLYFKKVLQMSNATAANSVTNLNGTMWLLTVVGGIMGDSYLGRFWTCVIFQGVHILGLLLLCISVSLDALKPAVCSSTTTISVQDVGTLVESCPKPSSLQTGIFMLALYIIALGSGGYLPVFQALGADQLKSAAHRTTFFGWLFVCTNVGAIVANTLFVWVENQGKWALAYWVATGVGILAFALFGIGTPLYRQFRPGGNALTRMAQVIVASLRNWKLEVPKDDTLLHELDEEELIRRGCQKMPHTNVFRFLDKAATQEKEQMVETHNQEGMTQPQTTMVSGWKLCYVTQVEEVKTLCRLLPIFLMSIPFTAIFTQVYTLFVEQAFMMDTKVGSFHIPPASMSVLNTLSIIVFTLLYPVVAVPIARLITHRKEGLAPLQRMAVGQVLSALAVAVSALLERKRLHLAMKGVQLSVLWQTPQQVILGASMVFLVVAGMDFFYMEAPHAIRGTMSSLSLVNIAIGSFLSSTLVSITVHFTTRNGHPGWIPPNLNQGHLDYFFWLLFVITIVTIILFISCAWWFNHTGMPHVRESGKLATKPTKEKEDMKG